MLKLSDTGRQLIVCIAVICAVICAVTAVFRFEPVLDYILGLVYGSAFAAVKVRMMEGSLLRSLDMEPSQAENYAKSRYVLRYLLTGAVLALAYILPYVNFLTAVAGVFTLQPAAYIVSYLNRKDSGGEIKKRG